MKKLLLSLAAVITCCMSIQSANVIVKMNSTSPWMNLVDKATGDTIDVGGAVNKTYTFDVPEGVYVLTALAKDSATVNGTIELDVQSVPSDSTRQFSILTNTVYATNKNDDKTAWEVGKDYTIAVDVSTREGERMVVTLGNSVTAGRKTFLALNGNSYYVSLIPSEERQAEGYMTNERSGTLTAGITVSGAIPMGGEYIVTLPADAELFIGKKFSHFTNFAKVEPSKTEVDGNSKKVYYRLADNQVYNFRTWKSGGLTQGGYFTMDIDAGENSYLKFSDSSYEAFGPKTIKHDVNWNGGYETGNILVNINERGHLQLKVGGTYDALAMRSWQLTDTQTANYFTEPDFHYTIIDLDGNPSTDVIEIDNAHSTTETWSTIKAVGKGTAIVLVTYDAIALNYYKYNAKADSLTKTPYMGGEYWGAIWPENTAAYVVSVGDDATTMQPNMFINEDYNEGALKTAGKYVDAEHDVFYYLDTEEGATYTFTPTGVDHIEIAYPTIGEQMATYHGFTTEGVRKNDDGSYTLLLKEGRQIVKLTDAMGNSIYQVLTAKPCHREITNASREGSTIFQAGDKVKIQYSGLHHPANKLAGIYNMSAYVTYNNIPNGSSLILGAGQYTFASAPTAQMVTVDIPADYTSEELVMNQGVIQVNGFGDPIGAHRSINKNLGRSPNFTAIAHKTYFGQLPEVRIPITETKYFVINLQSDVDSIQYTITQEGDTLRPDANGIYAATYGTYIIKASKPGYRCFRTTLTIADDAEGEQTCIIEMVKAADNAWDGTTLTEPRCEDDIYQISSGAELAWFAAKVNGGDYKLSAKLVSDIDLCGHDWTPIGGSKSNTAYQGTFDGDGHTIDGLYINNTLTYQALFGYTTNSHISGITVSGEVNAKQYVAGVVAFMGPKATVDRSVNKAKVTGTSTYVGGITGSVSQATSTLTNSYNLGDITGTTNCGGIAGYNHKNAVIENAFSLGTVTGTKVAACIGGTTAKDKALNIFATQEYDIILGQSTVTSDQMASGEVAYLLGEAFGQLIDTDTHPVLGGERVYKVTYTTNLSADIDSLYTNGTLPQFEDIEGHQTIWKTSLDGEELTEVSADSMLYVEYHKITYALTYVVDGEVYATDSIEYGAAITPIAEPVKEGYTFSGWSEVPETMPAKDVTVSGTFIVNKYLVTFKIGDEVIAADSLEYGATIVAPEAPEKEGHTFNGWGEVAENVPANDVTYESGYSVNSYLLTIAIDGEMVESDSIAYGTTITLPEAPTKEGYTFSGWSEVPETMPAKDVTVSGTYTVNIYKVYYYVGDELVHTAEVAYGETIPEYVYEPTTEGDELLGWIGDTYETMPAHDVTYTANIESDVLQLTIDNSQLTIHDLSGRKVTDTENLKRGIYIVNGKKVIVK